MRLPSQNAAVVQHRAPFPGSFQITVPETTANFTKLSADRAFRSEKAAAAHFLGSYRMQQFIPPARTGKSASAYHSGILQMR